MISVKNVLMLLAVAFTAYLAARGLWWTTSDVPQPLIVVAALALYLVTTWLCVFWEPTSGYVLSAGATDESAIPAPVAETESQTPIDGIRGPRSLPPLAQVLALACAAIVPSAIALAVGPATAPSRSPRGTWAASGRS